MDFKRVLIVISCYKYNSINVRPIGMIRLFRKMCNQEILYYLIMNFEKYFF